MKMDAVSACIPIPVDHKIGDAKNMLPHPFVLYDETGTKVVLTIPPSGTILRAIATAQPMGNTTLEDGTVVPILLGHARHAGIDNHIPEGPIIVSDIVARTINELESKDGSPQPQRVIWVPDTNPSSVVRDQDGSILGVKRIVLASGVL